jgi:cyclopropane-fatty-acyl-phospholipid synthase
MNAEAVSAAGNGDQAAQPRPPHDSAFDWFERLLAQADIRVGGDRPWDMKLLDPDVPERVLARGTLGLGESYMDGHWDAERLDEFFYRLVCAQMSRGGRSIAMAAKPPMWHLLKARWVNLQTQARAWQVGEQHYDLGNDFYAAWLDDSMTYSSGIFADGGVSLADAQRAKYERLAQQTGIRPGDDVLEIGSGWGGFAVFLAGELDCRVRTVTVSKEQHDYVEKLVVEHGLVDRVDARLQDFRTVEGSYDRIVSVEMMESIPQRLWDPYFRQLRQRVRPHGTVGLQLIVVADHHWRDSDEHPDFVRRYIFPGGQVPAPSVLHGLAGHHGLAWCEDTGFGSSYARTLAHWLDRFDAAWPRIAEMGFDERFRRMWRYYLAYCGAGFASGRTDVRQIVLAPR